MENQAIEISTKNSAISVTKYNGTQVDYYLFDTFEVHKNTIPASCVQDWHVHQQIEEIITTNTGTLHIEWLENNKVKSADVPAGEIIRLKKSIHRISNSTKQPATFTVFRFVPQKESQSETIKHDKISFTEGQIQEMLANR